MKDKQERNGEEEEMEGRKPAKRGNGIRKRSRRLGKRGKAGERGREGFEGEKGTRNVGNVEIA